MIQELKILGRFGGIRMFNISELSLMDLKTAWIEVSHEVKNLETLTDRHPNNEDLQNKLEGKRSMKERYEEEMEKRELLKDG